MRLLSASAVFQLAIADLLRLVPTECYCDSEVTVRNPSTQCNSRSSPSLSSTAHRFRQYLTFRPIAACAGDASKICGGGQALNIFHNPAISATPAPLSNGWTNTKRCLLDGQNGRLFDDYSVSSDAMTQQLCTSTCAEKGFDLAGLQYSSQWCVASRPPFLSTQELISFLPHLLQLLWLVFQGRHCHGRHVDPVLDGLCGRPGPALRRS